MLVRIPLLLAHFALLGCGINNNCGKYNPFGCAKGDESGDVEVTSVASETTSTTPASTSTGPTTTTGESSMGTTTPVEPTTAAETTTTTDITTTTQSTTTTESTETTDSTTDSSTSPVMCGNGMVEMGEQCDDGDSDDHDGCDTQCFVRRKVFVTSSSSTGKIGSLDKADGICNMLAKNKLKGLFRAWLSTDATANAPHSPLMRHDTSFVGIYELVTGDVVAHGWEGLASGGLEHAIDRDESGNLVAGPVWTNTTVAGGSLSTSNCLFWDSLLLNLTTTTGDSASKDSAWTVDKLVSSCATPNGHLYCFEVQ